MPDFMTDHVGLRKLAGLASDLTALKSRFNLTKETGVKIHDSIVWTIERPHGRLSRPACRTGCAREHHQFRRFVGLAKTPEDLAPTILGVAKHRGNELGRPVGRGIRVGSAGLARVLIGRLIGLIAAENF